MTDYRKLWLEDYPKYQQERIQPPSPREQTHFNRVYAHYLRHWLPESSDAALLDIGCGSGMLLYFFKKRGFTQIRGLDSSPAQADLARQLGLDVFQDDATNYLRNYKGRLSLITALDFVEHLTRDEALQFLDTAFQALRPGGHAIFQTPNGESPWVGNVLHGDLTHEQCYTPHLLEKMMRRAGFVDIQYRPCGPAPVDPVSLIRSILWWGMTLGCRMINLIEGAVSSGVYTRVFLIRGSRPD